MPYQVRLIVNSNNLFPLHFNRYETDGFILTSIVFMLSNLVQGIKYCVSVLIVKPQNIF